MKQLKKTLSVFFILSVFFSESVRAQVVTATGDTLICPPGTATLAASTTLTTTTNYSIASIPYVPYSYNSGTFIAMTDDSQQGPFPIGFNFEFFGVCYTDYYIGSNGWVAFSPEATTFTSAPIPSTNPSVPANCIMGPWQDWHPGIAGGPYINYVMQGVAPFRRLIVSWNNCPMFSCTTTLGTFQIVIYETTNVIENYLLVKPNCLAWAGGTAVQGLHDPTRTIGLTVPGRNSTQWTANNEGWRYTPSGAPTISWYQVGNPTVLGTGATFNASPSSAANYAAVVTDVCTGNSFSDTVSVGILPPPTAGTATVAPLAVCSGQSATLVLGGNSGAIQWQVSPNGTSWFNIPGGTNDTLSTGPVSSSLYFQAIVSAGPGECGTATSNIVVVTVNPAPPADAGLNTTICSGDSATLTATGGVSYSWMPGSGSGASITVAPSTNTTYTVTVTDGNGCTATDQVTVSTSGISTTAGPDITICSGGQGTLVANASGATAYLWTPAAGLSNDTISNPVANPTTTSTYVVTVTNANGCTGTDTITVNVTPAPVVLASNDTALCTGGSATLTATGATTYTWQPGNLTGSSVTVTPATTTTFVVTGDNAGCLNTDTVVVSITPPPVAFAGPDFGICTGAQGTLNATGGTAYSWAPSSGILGNPNQASVTIAPTTTTTYTVTVTGAGGCISTDQITVTINALPSVTATANSPTICSGASTGLSAAGASSYTWTPNSNLTNPTSAAPTANPTATTTYTVIGVDVNGCSDTDMVTVTVIQPPVITGYYSTPTPCGDTSGTIVLGSVSGSGGPYTYTLNGNPVTPINNTINSLNQGNYTVQVTDQYGCTSTISTSVGLDMTQLSLNGAASPMIGVAPQPVGFGSQTGGGINNVIWDFGDGSTPVSGSNPTHTYGAPGVYMVVVMGYNDLLMCTVYDTLYIEIFPEAIVVVPNVFTPN
ncbi:MAG: PKD domain-containing protein [Bacteroidetes bacterium]|nr:MAG: PKD domain-containing protein [Bacteroidota bacterium]